MASLSLQALISQAQAKVATVDAARSAEKRAKTTRTETVRTEAQAEADALRALTDWKTKCLILVYDAWECRCGRKGRAPQGVFFYQEHTRLASATRLVPPRHESEVPKDLPRMTKDETRMVAICQRCCPSLGFTKQHTPRLPMAQRQMSLTRPGEFVTDWIIKRMPAKEMK